MKKVLLAEKIGMTQYADENGVISPVTVLQVGPCYVVKSYSTTASGKEGVVLGFKEMAEKKCNRPQVGFFKKENSKPYKFLKSFQLQAEAVQNYQVGNFVSSDIFESNELISVRGVSSGKGFAGTIKRHNFRRGPRSHGSKNYRAPGSIGAGTTPGRVLRGKRMAGHMGSQNVTIKNLKVLKIDAEKNYIFVRGAVPGKPFAGVLAIFN